MAKPSKQAAAPEPPPTPQVGDKVTPEGSQSVYVITSVNQDGSSVNMTLEGTNLERFRVDPATLKFVETRPRPSRPTAKARAAVNVEEVIERLTAVQRGNLERLDDDIAILTKYLKTKGAPKAAISALEGLRSDQHKSWKATIDRIKEMLEE